MPIGQTLFLPPFDPLWFLVTHVKDLVNWPSIFKSHWMKEGVYEAFPSNIGRTKGYEDPDVNLQLLEMAAVAAAKVQKISTFPEG